MQIVQTDDDSLSIILELVGGAGGWARFAVAHAADFLVLYPLPTSAYPSFCYSLPEQIDDSCHGKGNEKLH